MTESSLRPGDLLSIISKWKSVGIRPDRAKDAAEDDKEFLAAMAYRKYQAKLKSTGGVDFDDLLLLTNELFNNFPRSWSGISSGSTMCRSTSTRTPTARSSS